VQLTERFWSVWPGDMGSIVGAARMVGRSQRRTRLLYIADKEGGKCDGGIKGCGERGGLYLIEMPELGGREDEQVMIYIGIWAPRSFSRLRPSDLVSIPRLGRHRKTV